MNPIHILPAWCNTVLLSYVSLAFQAVSLLKFSPPNLCPFLTALNSILQKEFVFWLVWSHVNCWLSTGVSRDASVPLAFAKCAERLWIESWSVENRFLFSCGPSTRFQDTVYPSELHDHTQKYTHTHTLGKIPLDEWSARRRDLYLTTHNTHNRQTFITPAGFEPSVPANERLQTHT